MTRIDEYNSLRDEILKGQERQFTLVNFSIVSTAAILTFIVDKKIEEPLLFLIPLLVLSTALFQLANILKSTFIKAVYIRNVIESKSPDMTWETFLHQYRNRNNRKNSDNGQRRRPITLWRRLTTFTRPEYLLVDVVPYLILLYATGFICVGLAIYLTHGWQQAVSIGFLIAWLYPCVAVGWLTYAIRGNAYEGRIEDEIKGILLGLEDSKKVSSFDNVDPDPPT